MKRKLLTTLSFALMGIYAYANECATAIPIANVCNGTVTVSGTTVGGTPQAAGTCIISPGSGGANWYTFVGDGNTYTASLVNANTNYDTKLWVFDGTCGAFNCVTGNDDFGGLQSQVSFTANLGTTYYVVVGGFGSNEGTYDLDLTSTTALCGAECVDAIPFSAFSCGSITTTGTTVGGTPQTAGTCTVSAGSGGANWYTFVGDGSTYNVSLVSPNTTYDTKLWVFDGTCGALNCVTGNDDFVGLQSQVSFTANLGTTYYIIVGGFSSNEGTYELSISNTTAPVADNATLADATGVCSVTMPTAPTATDNCSGAITGTTTTTFPITTQGTTVVTWTYDDGNGNTSTQTQNVVITDVTAPVADNATLADATGECSAAMPTAPTATDNCAGSITGTTTTTFPITAQGTTVVTWTYDDGNGNTSTQTQNVVITDVTAPVEDVTTLTDVTATCEVTSLTNPTATDNCSATVTVTNDATLPITMVGTTVVTWTYDDGNGNTSTQTQNVIVSGVDVTTTTSGLTITANNTTATSYQWIDCGNSNAPINGETNASYTATVNGDYAVIITDGNCSNTSSCVQIANVGIEELSNLGVKIYPNPNNGEFTISTTQNNVSITVFSINGRIIVDNLQITETNQLINLGDVESGIYIVKVTNQTSQQTIRLVVE